MARLRSAQPIFVVGYMHSGTTLMTNILNRHPETYVPEHETKFFLHLDLIRRHLERGDGTDIERFARIAIEEGFPFFSPPPRSRPSAVSDEAAGRAFRNAMDTIAAENGKLAWVEKTPTHVFHAGTILAAVPDAIFIELVRDPRDILASKKTRTETVWTGTRYRPEQRAHKHLEKSFDPLWDSISWTSAVRAADKASGSHPESWIRLRYEDLVTTPERVVPDLCRSIGLQYSPAMLDVGRGIPADPDELVRGDPGITTTSLGRWAYVLDGTEVALCQLVCRTEMRSLGYERVYTTGRVRAVSLAMRRSLPALIVRLSRQFRLGGRAYFGEVVKDLGRRMRALWR